MKAGTALRRYWPETLLLLSVALPWLALLVLGLLWLWQGGHTWIWALAAAALGLLAWPLRRLVRRRRNEEARLALSVRSEPSRIWDVREQEAWADVLAIANDREPFAFTDLDTPLTTARRTIETVARRFYPEDSTAWARFSLPEILLLAEQVSRELRREALRTLPGVRNIELSQLLWFKLQFDRYGPVGAIAWRLGYGAWRLGRFLLNPLQAAGYEISRASQDNVVGAFSYRLRAKVTQEFVRAVGRSAIDLYAGHLTLSDEELRTARDEDARTVGEPVGPIRLILMGQVSAGKSSLVNALAQETRASVGPLPTTARVAEYRLELEGRPTVTLVDMPGVTGDAMPELLEQAERADLIVWVASASRPAREPDRQGLENYRAWARTQLARRTPPVILALSHIDELRPASEWSPPFDVATPTTPKARSIRAAMDAVATALGLPVVAVVPVAMPPGRAAYNIDALWARIAVELDEARLVQLDRLRIGRQRLNLRELAGQLGNAGRFIIRNIANV